MKDRIGETAGGIWKIMKKEGEVNRAQLPNFMNEKSNVFYQGLGLLEIAFSKGKRTPIVLCCACFFLFSSLEQRA